MANEKPSRKIHKIKILRDVCIGAGTCLIVAPEAFDIDDEGIATVKAEALNVDDNTLMMAAQSCPTAAIVLFDEDGNEIQW